MNKSQLCLDVLTVRYEEFGARPEVEEAGREMFDVPVLGFEGELDTLDAVATRRIEELHNIKVRRIRSQEEVPNRARVIEGLLRRDRPNFMREVNNGGPRVAWFSYCPPFRLEDF